MNDIQKYLVKLHNNLNILQERKAAYGMDFPIELHNQIEDHFLAIELTEQAVRGELSEAEWREALKPLLVMIAARPSDVSIIINTDDPKDFLLKLNKNLNILREREAKYGGNVPLELLNQIDDHQKAIILTEQAIAGEINQAEWYEALKPLLVEIPSRTGEATSSGTYIGGIHDSTIAGGDVVGRDKIYGNNVIHIINYPPPPPPNDS